MATPLSLILDSNTLILRSNCLHSNLDASTVATNFSELQDDKTALLLVGVGVVVLFFFLLAAFSRWEKVLVHGSHGVSRTLLLHS